MSKTDTTNRKIRNCSKNRNRGCLNMYDVFLEASAAIVSINPDLEIYDWPLKELPEVSKGDQPIRDCSLPKGSVH